MLNSAVAARELFFRELARLTGAGISVTKAAELMEQRWRGEKVRAAMAAMRRGLEKGESIASAMAPELTPLEHSMVDAAERGGMLAQGFKNLEQYYHLLAHTRARIARALLYPVFLLHAGVIFPALVRGITAEDGLIRSLLEALLLLYGGLFLAWLLWRAVQKLATRFPVVDAVLMRVPVAGPARKALALARWHAVFHFHLKAGRRVSDGLRAAAAASQSGRVEAATLAVAAAAERGDEIGPELERHRVFPHEMTSALYAAELSGTLDEETRRQSQDWMIAAAERMDTAAEWAPRLIYGGVVIFMAVQILRLAAGIFSLYGKALNDLGF